jgi:hypothetical protein
MGSVGRVVRGLRFPMTVRLCNASRFGGALVRDGGTSGAWMPSVGCRNVLSATTWVAGTRAGCSQNAQVVCVHNLPSMPSFRCCSSYDERGKILGPLH